MPAGKANEKSARANASPKHPRESALEIARPVGKESVPGGIRERRPAAFDARAQPLVVFLPPSGGVGCGPRAASIRWTIRFDTPFDLPGMEHGRRAFLNSILWRLP
jgi:hypothetical protein